MFNGRIADGSAVAPECAARMALVQGRFDVWLASKLEGMGFQPVEGSDDVWALGP
jgi:hypothetical protein